MSIRSSGSTCSRQVFWKPTEDEAVPSASCASVREERQTEATTIVVSNPFLSLSIQQQRARLPIFKNRNHIIYLLEKYRVLIVVGETGCGKSTQVPQYLMEAGWSSDGRKIGVTQPRKVAVVTLADRVSAEVGCRLGDDVGYVVRFNDMTNKFTKIKYMTDGILVREMMSDPLLTQYSVLMIDEAHERSVNTDLILGLLKKVIVVRQDLRIVISSATLDAVLFRDFFELNETRDYSKNIATIISVEGHMHPVTIYYTKNSVPNYMQKTVTTVLEIHKNELPGDILAFLTGQDEVDAVCKQLCEEAGKMRGVDKLWVVPMYGALSASQQLKAFDSTASGCRKVVVATNIAETSVTIPGIAYVIDCGFVKLRVMNPENGYESLMKLPISKASAQQRSGRAGRVRPGKCYRLYPQIAFDNLKANTTPEIQRLNLASLILQLKALGVHNVLRFNYIARPPSSLMIEGLQLLYCLGALSEDGLMTNPLGLQMAEMPLPPQHSKALLCSGDFGCSEEIAAIIAMLQVEGIFVTPSVNRHKAELVKRSFSAREGDHITVLNVFMNFIRNKFSKQWCDKHFLNYRALYQAENIRSQLLAYLKRFEVPIKSCREKGDCKPILRCLVKGFFAQAAFYHYSGDYVTVRDEYHFKLYKGSALFYHEEYPKWILFTDVSQDSVRDVSVIEPEWLYQLAPNYYEFGTVGEIARKRKNDT